MAEIASSPGNSLPRLEQEAERKAQALAEEIEGNAENLIDDESTESNSSQNSESVASPPQDTNKDEGTLKTRPSFFLRKKNRPKSAKSEANEDDNDISDAGKSPKGMFSRRSLTTKQKRKVARKSSNDDDDGFSENEGTNMLNNFSDLLNRTVEGDEAKIEQELKSMKENDNSWTFANAAVRRQYLIYMVLLPVATAFNMSGTFFHKEHTHVTTWYIVTLAVMTLGVVSLFFHFHIVGNFDKHSYVQGFGISQFLNGLVLLIAAIIELLHGSPDLDIAAGAIYSLRSFLLFNLAISSAVLKHENISEIVSIGLSCFPMALYLLVAVVFALHGHGEAAWERAQMVVSDLLLFSLAGVPMLYWTGTQEQFMDNKTIELLLKNEENENKRDNNIEILLHLLPSSTVHGFLTEKTEMVEDFPRCTILFMKVIGLSDLSKRINTVDMVMLFNVFVCRCDNLTKEHSVEKIRTDFGVYLVASGLPKANDDHAENMAKMAVSLVDTVRDFKEDMGVELTFKIGMSSGCCVAGVIGTSRYQYDLIGDTVNVAARMCSSCPNGKIQLTNDMFEILQDSSLFGNSFESGGEKKIKGKGMMKVYYLHQQKASEILQVHRNAEIMAQQTLLKDDSPDSSLTSPPGEGHPTSSSARKKKRKSTRFGNKSPRTDPQLVEEREIAVSDAAAKRARSTSLTELTSFMNSQMTSAGISPSSNSLSMFAFAEVDDIDPADSFKSLTMQKANDLFYVLPLALALLCVWLQLNEMKYDDCPKNADKNNLKGIMWQAVVLPTFLFVVSYLQHVTKKGKDKKHTHSSHKATKEVAGEELLSSSPPDSSCRELVAHVGSNRGSSANVGSNRGSSANVGSNRGSSANVGSNRGVSRNRSSCQLLEGPPSVMSVDIPGADSVVDGSAAGSAHRGGTGAVARAAMLLLTVSLVAVFVSLCFRPSAVLFLWWVYVAHSYYLVFGVPSTCTMLLFSVVSVAIFVGAHLVVLHKGWHSTLMLTEADLCGESYWREPAYFAFNSSDNNSGTAAGGLTSAKGRDWLVAFAVQQLLPIMMLSMLTFHSSIKRLTLSYTHFRTQLLRLSDLDKSSAQTTNILERCTPRHFLDSFRRNQLPTVSGLGTMLFADLVSFTPFSASRSPMELADCLNEMYKLFDELADKHRVDKIKTIGDCYVACAGLITQIADHAEVMCKLACGLQQAIDDLNKMFCPNPDDPKLSVRIGLHTGTFVGGVIGSEKFGLDMWGREVEIAQKMESDGVPDRIMVSDATHKEAKRSKKLLFRMHKYIPLFADEWDSYWAGVPAIDSFSGVLDDKNSAMYYKSTAVYAFQSEDGFTFNKSWGDDVHPAEDWMIVGETSSALNDVYGVGKDYFKNNYKAAPEVGAHQYRKQQPCRAARAKCTLTCPDGSVVAEGDFVVQNIGKDGYYTIAGETFRNQYLVDRHDPIAHTLGSIPAETVSSQMRTWLLTKECQNDRVLSLKDVDLTTAKNQANALKIGNLKTGDAATEELKTKLSRTANKDKKPPSSPTEAGAGESKKVGIMRRVAGGSATMGSGRKESNKVAPLLEGGRPRKASSGLPPVLHRVYSRKDRKKDKDKDKDKDKKEEGNVSPAKGTNS